MPVPNDPIQTFIDRWSPSGGAKRANYALFLSELCDLVEVPRPEPTQQEDDANAYVFERRVVFQNPDGTQSSGRIDLYSAGRSSSKPIKASDSWASTLSRQYFGSITFTPNRAFVHDKTERRALRNA